MTVIGGFQGVVGRVAHAKSSNPATPPKNLCKSPPPIPFRHSITNMLQHKTRTTLGHILDTGIRCFGAIMVGIGW